MERDHTAVLNACAKVEGRRLPMSWSSSTRCGIGLSNEQRLPAQETGNRDRAKHVQCGVGSPSRAMKLGSESKAKCEVLWKRESKEAWRAIGAADEAENLPAR